VVTESEVKDIQLEKMTVKELEALEIELQDAIAARKLAEKAEVKEKLAALAEKSGFSVDELFGKPRRNAAGSAKGKVAPKYRNPQNASETWTGRGRMPLWIKTLTEKGAKRDKFLIK
jgi:DNA-binding protein H-NS